MEGTRTTEKVEVVEVEGVASDKTAATKIRNSSNNSNHNPQLPSLLSDRTRLPPRTLLHLRRRQPHPLSRQKVAPRF